MILSASSSEACDRVSMKKSDWLSVLLCIIVNMYAVSHLGFQSLQLTSCVTLSKMLNSIKPPLIASILLLSLMPPPKVMHIKHLTECLLPSVY